RRSAHNVRRRRARSRGLRPLKCRACGYRFRPKRKNRARWCSRACAQAAYRARLSKAGPHTLLEGLLARDVRAWGLELPGSAEQVAQREKAVRREEFRRLEAKLRRLGLTTLQPRRCGRAVRAGQTDIASVKPREPPFDDGGGKEGKADDGGAGPA